jgi:putative aldouronate transport system substrate-binding protein
MLSLNSQSGGYMKKTELYGFLVILAASIAVGGCDKEAEAATGTENALSGVTASGYPIVTDGSVTLRYWAFLNPGAAKYIQSNAENTGYQEVERQTGVKIEWIHPAGGMEREQFNLLMVSEDLPDLIASASYYKGGEFQGLYDGFFLNLTKLIPQHAPDYYKLMRDDPEFNREISDEDGNVCGFYCYKPIGDPPAFRVLLRKDILDKLGKDVPRIIADYESLFDAMLTLGVVPYMLASNGIERQFVGAYGILPKFYKDVNGTVQFGQVQPEFKQYLELMNRWYSKGYISKDFTSVNLTQIQTLFDSGKLGMWIGSIDANYSRGLTAGFEIAPAPFPRVKLGDKLHHQDFDIWPVNGRDNRMAAIGAKTKYPEIAVRWLNFGYAEKGRDVYNWGVEGFNYHVVNGKKVYDDIMLNNPRFSTEDTNHIYKMLFAPKLMEYGVVNNPNILRDPRVLAARTMWADDPDVDASLNLPPYQLTEEEQNLRSQLLAEINTYADEMTLKFITGVENLDRFDVFVSTLNSMRLPELLKSEQKAYDRYMARK